MRPSGAPFGAKEIRGMAHNLRVRDFMTKDPLTLKEDDLLRQAVEVVMVRRIRHIPVLDEKGSLVGIVTDRDVQGTLPSPLSAAAPEEYEALLETTPLARIMTRSVITVGADDLAAEAVETLLADRIDGLPVVENGRVVGIFTVRDALRAYLELLRGLGPR
jgi:CBS domain-containing protein